MESEKTEEVEERELFAHTKTDKEISQSLQDETVQRSVIKVDSQFPESEFAWTGQTDKKNEQNDVFFHGGGQDDSNVSDVFASDERDIAMLVLNGNAIRCKTW